MTYGCTKMIMDQRGLVLVCRGYRGWTLNGVMKFFYLREFAFAWKKAVCASLARSQVTLEA